MTPELQQTRAELRRLLISPRDPNDGAAQFPRSKAMRFVLDPRKRRLAMAVLATAGFALGGGRTALGKRALFAVLGSLAGAMTRRAK